MAREDAKITATELARCLKVSKAYISKIENGSKFPSWIMIQKIAKILNHDDLLLTFMLRKFPECEEIFANKRRIRARYAYDDSTIQQALKDSIPALFNTNKKDMDIATDILSAISFEETNVKLLPKLVNLIKHQRLLLKDLREELKNDSFYKSKHNKPLP